MHRGDQRFVHADRDGVFKQRGFEGGLELVELGVDHMGFDGGVENRGEGVFELSVNGIDALESVAADIAVGGFEKPDVVAVGEAHIRAGGVLDDGELEVGVVHDGEGFVGSAEEFAGESEHAFFRFGEGVRPAGFETLHGECVEFEFRSLGELAEFLFVDFHDFRLEPGGVALDLRGFRENAVDASAVFGDSGILIGTEVCEGVEFFKQEAEFVFRLKRLREGRGRVGETSFELLEFADETVDFPEVFLPVIVCRIHFREIPGHFDGQIGMFLRFFHKISCFFVVLNVYPTGIFIKMDYIKMLKIF